MKKILPRIVIGSIVVLLLSYSCYASGPGTTAANYLKIGVGARATAMGGAFTAIADDGTALYWNPAGLSQIKERQLSASYNSWFADIHQGYLSIVFPNSTGTLALGVNYVDMGKTPGYDAGGNPTGEFGSSTIQTSLGYAVGDAFSFGFAIGVSEDNIRETKESRYLGTVGILIKSNDTYSLGFVAQNIGDNSKGDPLPLIFKAGVGITTENLTFAADLGLPNDNVLYVCTGLEWWLKKTIALRIGYTSNQDTDSGYTVGAGIKTGSFDFDYAYVPYGNLGFTHRVSVEIPL